METKKQDRRVRYTNMMIRKSFIALLAQKPISKITVKEICEDADINRATFYSHFTDQYHLLHAIEDEIIQDIIQYLNTEPGCDLETTWSETLIKIFEYVYAYAEVCSILLGDTGDDSFQQQIMEVVQREIISALTTAAEGVSLEDIEYLYTFVALGAVGIIRKWLREGMQKPATEMAAMVWRIAQKGVSDFTKLD